MERLPALRDSPNGAVMRRIERKEKIRRRKTPDERDNF
jgi:hypothetical protein